MSDEIKYNTLSPEEEHIILNKGTERHLRESMTSTLQKEFTFAGGAMPHSTPQTTNLIPAVAGQPSTMKSRELSIKS